MVKIPHPPAVSNFNIPIPVSPSMKRSIPNPPKSRETINMTVGSFNSQACRDKKAASSAFQV